jgi:hypothetical protein
MGGPGIYKITFNPKSEIWAVSGPQKTTCYPLNKVEFISRPVHYWQRYYRLFIDSTGNIPAYVRGANMIEEEVKRISKL